MKTSLLLAIGMLAVTIHAAELTLGDWRCIGPFKDEEFGNLDRTLAYPFPPEVDYFRALGISPEDIGSGNLALLAKASSPDEMEIQGHAPRNANDGQIGTYPLDLNTCKLDYQIGDFSEEIFNQVRPL